jgi:hypothetical protein
VKPFYEDNGGWWITIIILASLVVSTILFCIYPYLAIYNPTFCTGYNTSEVLFKGTLDKYEVIGWDDYGGTQCNLSFSDIDTVNGATEQYRGYYGVYIGSYEQDIIVGHQYIVSEGFIHSGRLIRSLIDWNKGANLKEFWVAE